MIENRDAEWLPIARCLIIHPVRPLTPYVHPPYAAIRIRDAAALALREGFSQANRKRAFLRVADGYVSCCRERDPKIDLPYFRIARECHIAILHQQRLALRIAPLHHGRQRSRRFPLRFSY